MRTRSRWEVERWVMTSKARRESTSSSKNSNRTASGMPTG